MDGWMIPVFIEALCSSDGVVSGVLRVEVGGESVSGSLYSAALANGRVLASRNSASLLLRKHPSR